MKRHDARILLQKWEKEQQRCYERSAKLQEKGNKYIAEITRLKKMIEESGEK